MNLGIVIAVSDYGHLGSNLPGCVTDGKAIAEILRVDNRFDDVLVVTDNTNSSQVKSVLIDFISKHKDDDVEDIVFYFTGHGDYSGDEFYFLLSDYDKKKKKKTSLENTELDNLLRSLNPKNTVKIVDACHSGTPYIKDPDSFDAYLKSTKDRFNKCYFMFSSQADQYSYQDSHLSFFTKSIVESVHNHTSDTIRYKDVIDHVSDSFLENTNQTPFFIVQADFTEPFCTISETLKLSLSHFLESDNSSEKVATSGENKSILELVKVEAESYCTEEESVYFINNLIKDIKKTPLSEDLQGLYEVDFVKSSDLSGIPDTKAIGKWLRSNDHSLFAREVVRRVNVEKRVLKRNPALLVNTFTALLPDSSDDEYFKTVTKSEIMVKGFRSTVDLPISVLKIYAKPKFPNISTASAYIIPLISKTTLQLFYAFDFFTEEGWNEKRRSSSVDWSMYSLRIKEEGSSNRFAKEVISEFSNFLLSPLLEKFSLSEAGKEIDIIEETGNDNKTA